MEQDIDPGVERSFLPSPEEERRILKLRAVELAKAPKAAGPKDALLEVVEFELAGERYGFPLEVVDEVCLLRNLTPVPCTPASVAGIINLRGEIRTVLDLKPFFELPAFGITEGTHVIMVRGAEMQLGILTDTIHGVGKVSLADLQPTLPTLIGVRADYLLGVTGERLVVLDAGKILSDPRILVYEELQT